jgi:predicted GIY-YIG superfamily endonuclease
VPRKQGVYVIHFKNGERYVGRSRNMHKRVHQHFGSRGRFRGRGYSDISHIHSYTHHTRRYTRYQEQRWINHYRGHGLLNRRNEWARFTR